MSVFVMSVASEILGVKFEINFLKSVKFVCVCRFSISADDSFDDILEIIRKAHENAAQSKKSSDIEIDMSEAKGDETPPGAVAMTFQKVASKKTSMASSPTVLNALKWKEQVIHHTHSHTHSLLSLCSLLSCFLSLCSLLSCL